MRRAALILALLATAVAAKAPEENESAGDPDLRRAAALIEAGQWAAALPLLESAEARAPESADVQNLLGFARRKLGDLDRAAAHYDRALRLAPRHRGALEYQGELFLMRGQPEAARANLARLAEICPKGCEERDELEAAVAAHAAGRSP